MKTQKPRARGSHEVSLPPHTKKSKRTHPSHCPAEEGALTPPVSLLASSPSKTRAQQQQQLPALLRWQCHKGGEEGQAKWNWGRSSQRRRKKTFRASGSPKESFRQSTNQGASQIPPGKGRVHSTGPRKPPTRVTPGHINTHACQLN